MINIVCALGSVEWEAQIVSALSHPMLNMAIQRRCLDAIDVRSAIRVLDVDLVLFSDATLRLDRECIDDLLGEGIRVVALSNDADWWASLGVVDVLPIDESDLSTTVKQLSRIARQEPVVAAPIEVGHGRLIAVTSFGGGAGCSTISRELAYAHAHSEQATTVLIDADVISPSLGIEFDDDDLTKGFLQLVRHVEAKRFDDSTMSELLTHLYDNLWFARGLPSASRWTDLRASALRDTWNYMKTSSECTVVDVGSFSNLLAGESFLDVTPRRGATLVTAIEAATEVVLVARADKVGIARLIKGVLDSHDELADKDVAVVLTRGSEVNKDAVKSVQRHTGIATIAEIPESLHFAQASNEHTCAAAYDNVLLKVLTDFLQETDSRRQSQDAFERQRTFLSSLRNRTAA